MLAYKHYKVYSLEFQLPESTNTQIQELHLYVHLHQKMKVWIFLTTKIV